MIDFYVHTIGLQVSDRGHAAGLDYGPEIAFLSWDPSVTQHQLALAAVRRDSAPSNTLSHIAFEVDTLDDLRSVWEQVRAKSVQRRKTLQNNDN